MGWLVHARISASEKDLPVYIFDKIFLCNKTTMNDIKSQTTLLHIFEDYSICLDIMLSKLELNNTIWTIGQYYETFLNSLLCISRYIFDCFFLIRKCEIIESRDNNVDCEFKKALTLYVSIVLHMLYKKIRKPRLFCYIALLLNSSR